MSDATREAKMMELIALEVLAETDGPVGAIRLASSLRSAGIARGEATAGRFLRILDERKFTETAGSTRGRVLTEQGRQRLRRLREELRIESHEAELSRALAASETDELIDLLSVRQLVETECAVLAAQRATPEEREALVRQAREHHHLHGDSDDTTTPSMAFHRDVAAASHSRPLIAIAQLLLDPVNDPLEKLLAQMSRGIDDTDHQLGDHVVLAEAIAAGDVEAARDSMDRHISRLRAAVMRYLDEHAIEDAGQRTEDMGRPAR